MAYRASQELLFKGLQEANSRALKVKNLAIEKRDESLAGPTPRGNYITFMRELTLAVDAWNRISALPGIVQYARDQNDDQTYDLTGEFTTMRDQAIVLRDLVFSTFPVSAGGAWEVQSHTNDGIAIALTFSTAQLSTFRTEADALIATIS